MTKLCPKCKTENVDNSSFCQNCGKDLSQTSQAIQRTQRSERAKSWWNKQTKRNKAGIGIGVCCIGLILIIAIAGVFSPDKTTATTAPITNISNSSSTTNTFTGSDMSFIIPNGWTVTTNQSLPVDNVNNNLTTALIMGSDWIDIQIIPNDTNNSTLNSEYTSTYAEGWKFQGIFKSNGTAYDVFTSPNGQSNEYLFNKNGNTFELLSNQTDENTQTAMDDLVGSIN